MVETMRKRIQREDGFTLVELIVVIGIIGILVAIAALVNTGQKEKAAEAAVISDLRNMGQLMEEYEITFLHYPEILPSMPTSDGVVLTLTEDGACVVGNAIGYTPEEITWYYDSVSNKVTDVGCSPVVDTDPLGIVDAAIYAGAYFTATNAWTVVGQSANVYVNGDYTCNSFVTTAGDLIVQGNVHMIDGCYVGGSVKATGYVQMQQSSQVGGDVVAEGYVKLNKTCDGSATDPCSPSSIVIGGDIRTLYSDGQNGITSVVQIVGGTTRARLNGETDLRPDGVEVLGGTIITGDSTVDIPYIPWPPVHFNPNPTPRNITWNTFFNEIAADNGSTTKTSCTISNAKFSVDGNITVTEPLVVNAMGDCPSGVKINGQNGEPMRVTLFADLTIYSKQFDSQTGGITFISGDGLRHNVRLISPLPTGVISPDDMTNQELSEYGISFGATPVTTDDKATLLLYTPGPMKFGNGTDFRGQGVGGSFYTSGSVTVDYVPVPEW